MQHQRSLVDAIVSSSRSKAFQYRGPDPLQRIDYDTPSSPMDKVHTCDRPGLTAREKVIVIKVAKGLLLCTNQQSGSIASLQLPNAPRSIPIVELFVRSCSCTVARSLGVHTFSRADTSLNQAHPKRLPPKGAVCCVQTAHRVDTARSVLQPQCGGFPLLAIGVSWFLLFLCIHVIAVVDDQ